MQLSKYRTSSMLFIISVVILLIINLLISISINYFFKEEALKESREKAELILDKNLSIHDYFTELLKPHLFDILQDTIETGQYFEPSWMSSTYAIRELNNFFQKRNQTGYYYKDAAINARSPENEADSIERLFLENLSINASISEQEGITTIAGVQYYFLLKKGEIMEENCLRCHSVPENAPEKLVEIYGNSLSFNRNVGDIISVVSIRIPINEAFKRAEENIIQLIFVLSITYIFGILLVFIFQKILIVNPIETLQFQAAAIAGNNSLLGQKIVIHSTKEVSDFVESFNIMSSKLLDYQNSLEDKVREKTFDLENKIEQVKQLNDTKDLLFSIIAHDLKSPFQNILGFAELLLTNVHKYDREKIKKQAEYIYQVTEQTYLLLEDLFVWAKSQSGNLPFEPEKFNLLEICNIVFQKIELTAHLKKITATINVSDTIEVFADINMFRAILRNLLTNAIKFTNEAGRIEVLAEVVDNYVIITVSDSGVGLTEENIQKIWNNAQTFSTRGTANEKGTGFGLLLCKYFVDKHGGKIWVESKKTGGSNFKFSVLSA